MKKMEGAKSDIKPPHRWSTLSDNQKTKDNAMRDYGDVSYVEIGKGSEERDTLMQFKYNTIHKTESQTSSEHINNVESPMEVHIDKKSEVLSAGRVEKHHDCPHCNKSFRYGWMVRRHILSHTGEKPHTCTKCGKGFAHSHGLHHHQKQCVHGVKRAVKKQLNCSFCDKSFSQKGQLLAHMKSHNKGLYTCILCGKIFRHKSSIRVHLRSHTGEKPYPCPHCVKQFMQKGDLQKHIMIHTGEKPYTCSVCSKGFIKKADLKSHFVIHTGEKPHKCPNCSKAFRQASSLREHKKLYQDELFHRLGVKTNMDLVHPTNITSSEKDTKEDQDEIGLLDLSILDQFDEMEIPHKYVYGLCDTEIGQQTTGHIIQWLQTENRLYFCVKCNMRFKNMKLFRNHVQNTHFQRKLHKCDYCEREFLKSSNLKQHIYSHTGERPHTCPVCQKGFALSATLKKHLKIHRHVCTICSKGFSRLSLLENHQKTPCFSTISKSAKNENESETTHKEGKHHVCPHCSKQFRSDSKLKRHIMIHTGEKPYTCTHCDKCFNQSSTLKQHQKVHAHEKTCFATISKSDKDKQECSELILSSELIQEYAQTVNTYIPNECVSSNAMKKLDENSSQNGLNCRELLSPGNVTLMDQKYSCCISCWLCVHGFSSAEILQEHLALHKGVQST